MEILEQGNQNKIKKRKCRNCGCVFTYEPKDVKDMLGARYVECPQCKAKSPIFPKAVKIAWCFAGGFFLVMIIFFILLYSGVFY